MSLKAGIIGLPNVGKSTIFNAITNSKVEAANYPFATIEPNVGIVNIEDERLDFLSNYWKSKKKVNNNFTFIDIAGLVKGASKGEGLGNKFLSHIRQVDILVEVVRCFDNKDVIHVDNIVDPIRDIKTIEIELIFADLEIAEKRNAKIEKKAEITKDKELVKEVSYLKKIIENLNKEILISNIKGISKEELEYASSLGLITSKKIIFAANIDENDISNVENNKHYKEVLKYAKNNNNFVIPISAKIEHELSLIPDKQEREMMIKELNYDNAGLNKIVKIVMNQLNIGNFFTAGPEETRAWSFKVGEPVKESAGIIHTDISRGFIAAEIYDVLDLEKIGDFNELKSKGKVRSEGKSYQLKEGDVCYFKFNV